MKVYVINYSQNPYQKERVSKAVNGLGGEILNDFSSVSGTWNELAIPDGDSNLMTSAEEIWFVLGNKSFFEDCKKAESLAKKSRTKIRYFSLSHAGRYQGKIREVERDFWLKKIKAQEENT